MLVGEEVLPERFLDDFARLLRRYQVRRCSTLVLVRPHVISALSQRYISIVVASS